MHFLDERAQKTVELIKHTKRCEERIEYNKYFDESEKDTLKNDIQNFSQYGTRHQKALRTSLAYPDTLIAITVSQSGPIRVWVKGMPILNINL